MTSEERPKHPGGRPTDYTEEKADEICRLLTEGNTLLAICKMSGQPAVRTVYDWLSAHPEFLHKYARAREIQADIFADMIMEVAFDTQGDTYADEYGNPKANHEYINRSRLKVDALKWKAAKTAPKKYGDKVDTSVDLGSGTDSKIEIRVVRSDNQSSDS